MADISDTELREKCDARFAGLKATRGPWDTHCDQVARYEQPRLNRFVRTSTDQGAGSVSSRAESGRKGWVNERLYNTRAVEALDILANGMSAGLCSPSRPWFKIQTQDPDLMEYQPVKEYLSLVERAIYDLLARCGFYPAATQGFGDLGRFGSEACLMTPHWEYGAACFPLEWGEYWLGQNDALRVDTLYRTVDFTVAQLYAKFPNGRFSKTVREHKEANRLDQIIVVIHAIEPNIERVYGRYDKTNMAYRSVYWELNSDKGDGVIAFGGFESRPFWAPRWQTAGTNVYSSTCPGFRVLPNAKKLQILELRKQQAIDYIVKPPLYAPTSMNGVDGGIKLNPGQVTYGAASDSKQVFPLWQVDHQAIDHLGKDIDRTEAIVDTLAYADLFKAFIGRDGGAYENIEMVARKHEEQLTQLGPVVDRAGNEKLDPAIDQAFNILLRTGQLPDAPEELQGQELKIRYDGILAQAQRMIGLGAIERTSAYVGGLAASFPGLLDKIDADQTVDEYAALAGAPPRMIRADDAVAQIRQQRADEEQRAKLLETMPAIESGAKAASLLAQTDTGGGRNALQQLLPGV